MALSVVQCSGVKCSAVQCSAVQFSAVQCCAVQCKGTVDGHNGTLLIEQPPLSAIENKGNNYKLVIVVHL